MATGVTATAGGGAAGGGAAGGGGGTQQPRASITACPLRPFFLETVGEPPIPWQVWLPMFKDHMIAYGQDELPEARRIAILKSSLGAEGYRVCLSLCAGDNLSFDDVLARLTDRFAPKVSNIFARSVFHRRAQLQGESCVQFVTALRSLMAKCGYDEHVQAELLRDRFVAGCDSDTIREKLLLEPDTLTLEQALVIAGNSERVAVESKNVHSLAQVDSSSVMQVSSSGRGQGHRWSPRGTGGSCFACGQVLRQILEDHRARDSNSEDSFLADVMYSLAQGQAGVNDDKLTEDAHANDFSPAPLFDGPSTSQGTSNAAAFGCVITRAFVEAANDNDDSSDSEADRAPKTFAQLFEEMRSRAMSREAQAGNSTKRGSSPHSGFVKNKSASAVTNVSGKRKNNECGHSDDVMSKRAKYACSNCYRTFSTASNLQRHERGHVGEKAYTCVKCNMSFSRAQGLSEHTNSHDGVKPHVCNACEKAFDTKRKLTQHAKTHAENRAYSCVTCGQAFKQKTTLGVDIVIP
jgi:DNA-directed RNA polymerase subunit RPC12/RpoP